MEIDATNLPRAMNCPGWLFMPRTVRIAGDPDARNEGTAAHWVAQQLFNGSPVEPDSKAPNGYLITAQMITHASEYVSALDCGAMEVVTSFGNVHQNWFINGRADHIKFSQNVVGYINGGNGNVFDDIEKTLTVDDFKYGWRLVEPEMNWTLIGHAIGYSIRENIRPDRIVFRIHQPRPHHPGGKLREWSITGDDLLRFYEQIDRTLSAPPQELRTGPHCAKCDARFDCPAFRAASMNAIDTISEVYSDDLPPEILSSELDVLRRAADVLKTRLEALEELAAHKIKNGQPIPFYAMEPRYGDSRFKTGIDATTLKLLTGIDCAKVGTITPAEAKRRAKGNDPALMALDTVIDRPMIGTKLVRIDPTKHATKLLKK